MGVLDGVLGTVGGVVGGVTGGSTSGGSTGSVSGSVGGTINTGGLLGPVGSVIGAGSSGTGLLDDGINVGALDGWISTDLLSDDALLDLGISPDASGQRVNLAVLDQDGDGLVDLDLLDEDLGLSLLDRDGDGLIDLDLIDTMEPGLDPDGDIDGDGNPNNNTDANDFDVVLMGTAGADTFVLPPNQTTYVEGFGNTDSATYAASAQGFSYAVDANGVFISDGTEVDYLQNVERINFSDGTLHLDTGAGETAGYAYRIYQAAFDRTPDTAGLAFWIDELDEGKSMIDVAADFLFSAEFQQTYGQLSTTDFVEELYENILQRAGEDAGVDFWTQQLDSGARGRAEVLAGFSDSAENVALVGATIDAGLFVAA